MFQNLVVLWISLVTICGCVSLKDLQPLKTKNNEVKVIINAT